LAVAQATGEIGQFTIAGPTATASGNAQGLGPNQAIQGIGPTGSGSATSNLVRADVAISETLRGNSSLAEFLIASLAISTTSATASLAESLRGSAAISQETSGTLGITESANNLAMEIFGLSSVSILDQSIGKVSTASAKLGQSAIGIANLGGISVTDSARFGGAVSNGV